MKVLLSVAVWGEAYVKVLTDYSLASQLSLNNIPKLADAHEVTYHIVTTRQAANQLRRHPTIKYLGRHCSVLWEYIEEHGYNPRYIPHSGDGGKYPFLSRLQNISIARSVDYDVLVFNYADFVWADGSLFNTIELMQEDIDAVMSFCLPVDKSKGQKALTRYYQVAGSPSTKVIELPSRAAAALVLDHLHRETKLRFWEGPHFTTAPTYLLWPVTDEGLIVRAYHQTVLALRVQRTNPEYRAGIRYGSLDGYFTTVLAEKMRLAYAADSDRVLVFSLFDANINSRLPRNQTREDAMQACLRISVSEAQRRFSDVPIYVKRKYENSQAWRRTVQESGNVLQRIHQRTRANAKAFEEHNAQRDSIAFLEDHWRSSNWSNILRSIYLKFLPRFVAGPIGSVIKNTFGRERARSIRLAIEGWLSNRRK